MRSLTLACSLLLSSSLPILAAGPKRERKPDVPEMVAKASFEAAKNQDWKRYAELLHPDSLRDFRALFLPVLQAAAKHGREGLRVATRGAHFHVEAVFREAAGVHTDIKIDVSEIVDGFAEAHFLESRSGGTARTDHRRHRQSARNRSGGR